MYDRAKKSDIKAYVHRSFHKIYRAVPFTLLSLATARRVSTNSQMTNDSITITWLRKHQPKIWSTEHELSKPKAHPSLICLCAEILIVREAARNTSVRIAKRRPLVKRSLLLAVLEISEPLSVLRIRIASSNVIQSCTAPTQSFATCYTQSMFQIVAAVGTQNQTMKYSLRETAIIAKV